MQALRGHRSPSYYQGENTSRVTRITWLVAAEGTNRTRTDRLGLLLSLPSPKLRANTMHVFYSRFDTKNSASTSARAFADETSTPSFDRVQISRGHLKQLTTVVARYLYHLLGTQQKIQRHEVYVAHQTVSSMRKHSMRKDIIYRYI